METKLAAEALSVSSLSINRSTIKIYVPRHLNVILMSSKIKVLEEELKRKDKIIEHLKEENLILLKTAFKKAYENLEKAKKVSER